MYSILSIPDGFHSVLAMYSAHTSRYSKRFHCSSIYCTNFGLTVGRDFYPLVFPPQCTVKSFHSPNIVLLFSTAHVQSELGLPYYHQLPEMINVIDYNRNRLGCETIWITTVTIQDLHNVIVVQFLDRENMVRLKIRSSIQGKHLTELAFVLHHPSNPGHLWNLIRRQIPSIVDVLHSLEWHRNNPHIMIHTILVHQLLMQPARPLLKRFSSYFNDGFPIPCHYMLAAGQVPVQERSVLAANVRPVPKTFRSEHSNTCIWIVWVSDQRHLNRHHDFFKIHTEQRVTIHRGSPFLSLLHRLRHRKLMLILYSCRSLNQVNNKCTTCAEEICVGGRPRQSCTPHYPPLSSTDPLQSRQTNPCSSLASSSSLISDSSFGNFLTNPAPFPLGTPSRSY